MPRRDAAVAAGRLGDVANRRREKMSFRRLVWGLKFMTQFEFVNRNLSNAPQSLEGSNARLSLLWESAKDFLSILLDLLIQTEQTPLDPSVTFRDQPAIVFAVSHASFPRFALTWVALAVIFALSLFWSIG